MLQCKVWVPFADKFSTVSNFKKPEGKYDEQNLDYENMKSSLLG
jgi:hypothetical protein